jgi:hypothetical protein
VTDRSRVDLPLHVQPPYEVFINGVEQMRGTDFEAVGSALLFTRTLAKEGKLGFWRWLSIFIGAAGTYRKHDNVVVVYSYEGRRLVANLTPHEGDE